MLGRVPLWGLTGTAKGDYETDKIVANLRRILPSLRVPGPSPKVLDGQCAPEVSQDLQQDPRPVAAVAELAQVRQRLLRGAYCAL